MHLVHQNVKYDRPLNETETGSLIRTYPDAFMVIAVFFNETLELEHPTIAKVVEHFAQIDAIHAQHTFAGVPIRLDELLPERRDLFYVYSGSYTTPACEEVVTWVIFPQPLPVSPAQMKYFHDLITHHKLRQAMKYNSTVNDEDLGYYRHIHELGSRKVFTSQQNVAPSIDQLSMCFTSHLVIVVLGSKLHY